MRYRKKPVEIEAFQWFGDERQTEDPEWIVEALEKGTANIFYGSSVTDNHVIPFMSIKTLERTMIVHRGDYIIKGVQGEIYPCKPDIFEATYENIDDIPLPSITTEGSKN